MSLADWLPGDGKKKGLRAITSTLGQRLAHHDYKAAFIVSNHKEAVEAVTRFAKGVTDESALSGRVLPSDVKKDVIWVFSGHGAQLVSAMYFAEAH